MREINFLLICLTSVAMFIAGTGVDQHGGGSHVSGFREKSDYERRKIDNNDYLPDVRNAILKPVKSIRKRAIDRISNSPISKDTKNMLKALLLAYRRDLSYDLRDSYSYLGIAHFLALSGLHLGLVVIPITVFLSWIGLSRRWKEKIVLVFVIAYTAVADFPPSLLRAAALYMAIVLYRVLNIRADLINPLILGSLVLVMIKRELIFDIGFELSFLAVTGIACLALPVFNMVGGIVPDGWRSKIIKILIYPIIVTVSVNLFTLPLVLLVFKRSALISPLANMLMIVPVTFFLYTGFAYLIMPVELIRGVLSIPLEMLSKILCMVPVRMAEHNYPAIYTADIEFKSYIAAIILISVSVAAGIKWRGRFLKLSVLGLVSFSVITGMVSGKNVKEFKLNGGINRTGKRWSKNNRYYCHGGGIISINNGMGKYDARRVLSELYENGIGNIDNVIITSSEVWNAAGIALLINRLGVKRIICSKYFVISESDRFKRYGVDKELFEGLAGGDTLLLDGTAIEILSPPYPTPKGDSMDYQGSILRFNMYQNFEKGDISARNCNRN